MTQSTLSNTLRAVLHGRQFFVYANEEQLRHAQSVAMDLLQAIVDRFGSLRAAFSKLDTSGSGWVPLAVGLNTCSLRQTTTLTPLSHCPPMQEVMPFLRQMHAALSSTDAYLLSHAWRLMLDGSTGFVAPAPATEAEQTR